jgi:diguanylate cyclase (GGDEF)-like protein/PAS domain S-box-containing protein
MPKTIQDLAIHDPAAGAAGDIAWVRRQEALLETGALQSAIFNSANFSSIATDAKGVIQIFNVGAERMLGYTAAEVMNKITPADISDPQEVIARAKALSVELGTTITPGFEALAFKASRGIEDIYELTYIRKDGSRFPAVVSVTALRDAKDAIIGYLLIGTDNTARKRAEEELIKAGALQSAIFNSANFSSIATDAKGVIQIFNVGAERMLGYTAAEVMNKITPADISDSQEVIARATALSVELGTTITPGFEALVFKASRGIEDIYELTYIRKDGSRFPAVVSVTALRDAHDAIIGYLLIGTDNTARKQIEAEQQVLGQRLRDHQFYTRSLFESNIDALMTTDPSGIITDVNKQMEALTGCTRDELIGAAFKNYFTDPKRAEAAIKLVLSERKVTNYELTARARDGKVTVVSYNAVTLYDRDRKLQGVFAAARDITERKQAEELILNLASYDPLTRLPNRRLLNDRLGQAMAASKRSGRHGALLFMDLDNLKAVNDTHGHSVGDALLMEVALRVGSCVRDTDTVARFGGDEFVVVLGELDADKTESLKLAGIVAEKVRAILDKPFVLKIKKGDKPEATLQHHCTSSIGVGLFLGQEFGADEIVKRADVAMYQAKKESGGNAIRFVDA